MGVRVGGIEGGRSARLSPVDLRINNIFGLAIKSHNQINFKPTLPQGFESVKSLVPLNIKIRGEDRTRPVRPSVKPIEHSRPRTRVVAPEAAPVLNPAITHPEVRVAPYIQQHVLARRLRVNVARLGGLRVQAATPTSTNTEALPATQTQPQVDKASEAPVLPRVNQVTRTKKEVGNPVVNQPRSITSDISKGEGRQMEKRKREYLKVDEETNAERLLSLRESLRRLQSIMPGVAVSGRELINAAGILAKRFRSNLLRQLGFENRIDGSAYQLGENLSAQKTITEAQLKKEIEINNAVEKSDKPIGTPARFDETQKVLTPPKSPPEEVPDILIRDQVEIVDLSQVGKSEPSLIRTGDILSIVVTEPKILEDVKDSDEPINFMTHPLVKKVLFDNRVDNSSETERRQLVLAA